MCDDPTSGLHAPADPRLAMAMPLRALRARLGDHHHRSRVACYLRRVQGRALVGAQSTRPAAEDDMKTQIERAATVRALRDIVAILESGGAGRVNRAIYRAASALARWERYRQRARRRRNWRRGAVHGQIERALWIMAALRDSQSVTCTMISNEFGISARSAHRDVSFLRRRGAPISWDARQCRFYLRRPWQLDPYGPLTLQSKSLCSSRK